MLEEMKPGIFASGCTTDDSEGINMSNSGKPLRWVAVRGGIPDWTIYIGEATLLEVAHGGDKVISENNIKKLVPCDDEAFNMYRF